MIILNWRTTMKKAIRLVTCIFLATWGTQSFAKYVIDFTVPLELNSFTEAVKQVLVSCFVQVENENLYSSNSISIPVDGKTGRPTQNTAVIRVVQKDISKGAPSKWFCTLRPAPDLSGVTGGGMLPPSKQSNPDFQPAAGTELVEQVSGTVPVVNRQLTEPRRSTIPR